jgi:hypothetical protein
MKMMPWGAVSLLKGMSIERLEYSKGGGSPTDGVAMSGLEGVQNVETRE